MHQTPTLLLLSTLLLAGCGKKDDAVADTSSSSTTTSPTACEIAALTERAWQDDGSTAPALRTVVADFTVSTRAGDWTLSENWSGCDSYLFIPSVPRQAEGWPTPLWERDTKTFLNKLPANVHVFFVSSADNKAEMDADLDLIEDSMEDAITKQDEAVQDDWRSRIHYVDKQISKMTDTWVGQYLTSPGYGFGIDRFQVLRDVGSFADGERYDNAMGWFEPNLSQAANEPISYNFASDRQDLLDAQQDVLVVPTFTGEVVSDGGWSGVRGWVDVDLPDAATMAGFNALDVDMLMTCDGDGEFGTCPAWDRITTLYVCDQDLDGANPYENRACQPQVNGVTPAPEVMGTCDEDGVLGTEPCRDVVDCPSGTGVITCVGYAAEIEEVIEIIGDVATCGCADVMSEPYDGARTCDQDGLGYGDCSCSCNTELSRWITTYHREGHWVTDADFALPWFQRGGTVKLSYYSIDPWEIAIDLRFHNEDKADVPSASYSLFEGGTFNATYNDKYEPLSIEIPSDATKVELAVIITGHGQETPGNCAEFCNTQHHFGVNGTENLVDFPWLDDTTITGDYCQNQVDIGTVPNQYGTWFYARSNWCPGKEVVPIYIDVTNQVNLGQLNTFTYAGDRNGAPYSANASIDLGSFLVIHK
ncbi:MAG: hypothetical protein GWP91_05595 [Rhodobacterales bacterium]|nr:hypothetical protein [Rhodobacterales bacterium]